MAQTVIGMFESSSKAQEAVQELVQSGISRDRIDVSGGNTTGSSYSSGSTGTSSGSTETSYGSTGTSYGSTGTSYGASDDDHESGISKFFKSLFGNDDDDADKYTRVASNSQSIVTVHAQSRNEAERVADILDDNGAVDVDEQASRMGYSSSGSYSGTGNYSGTGADVTGLTANVTSIGAGVAGGIGADVTGTTGSSDISDTSYTDRTRTGGTTGDESRKIPIIEENLEVGKREVNTGGVRLRSRIVERPVEESVRLREERVNVERTTVDRPATAADFTNFQERDIEMVERAEVPVVNKEARVVEEVSINKEVEERTETVKDTVRKTEVDVENLEKDELKGKSSYNSNNDL